MKIHAMVVGSLATNCYVVYCEATRKAAVIDPGGSAEAITAFIRRENLDVDYIINTHGHADHVWANMKVKEATGAPILIHEADAGMLTSPQRNLSVFLGGNATCGPADQLLKEGDTIAFGAVELAVLHTPGHTPGGISLLAGPVLFSGDTLFAESVGRSDLPGGSHSQLIASIVDKLMPLDDKTRVLPGHGPETTIGWERTHNPFIQ